VTEVYQPNDTELDDSQFTLSAFDKATSSWVKINNNVSTNGIGNDLTMGFGFLGRSIIIGKVDNEIDYFPSIGTHELKIS
jgi:hypothetical protein